MCGIAGFAQRRGNRPLDLVETQLRQLTHRGPNALGWLGGDRGVVGQTRLSVIDLETGDPPITDESGRISVALNGEIYNFAALREHLAAAGHVLRTRGDTEVIAHLAENLSPVELARALDGMFAFAVWDERTETLILARDRFGKKPLYWWSDGATLVFGSELKAVLAHPDVPRRLNPRAIAAYLTFGYVPTPETFYDGIVSLAPGHVLVFDEDGAREERYWELTPRPLEGIAIDEAASLVRDELEGAISRRLVADVPLGAFLSGGLDSSAIVALASRHVPGRLSTFTIGFEDEDGFDERPFARQVAERYGTDHHEFVVHPHAVDLVERLLWHHDQPFGDSSAIPTYLLAEMTAGEVTVALSGDGGDELFAGYERFAAARWLDRYGKVPSPVRSLGASFADRLPGHLLAGRVGSGQRFMRRSEAGLPDAFISWLAYVQEDERAALLGSRDDWAIADYHRVWNGADDRTLLTRLLDVNRRTYLVDDLLVKADRMSMAHGLEVRSPFLDPRLAEVAAGLADPLLIRGLNLKRVLKEALADLLPDEILHRRKRGFGVPLARWFRGELEPYLRATVGAPDARIRQHLVGEAVDRLLEEHWSGARDHGHALWALLTLELFLRREGW